MVDRLSGIPVYRQIADDLESVIRGGRWPEGAAIPSLNELAAMYGVNRQTARAAVRRLEQQGVVTIQPGDFTRVRGIPQVEVRTVPAGWRVGARMPTDEERVELGIAVGVPVLVLLEPVSRADGTDWVEFGDPLPGDRYRLVPEPSAQDR